MLSYALFEGRPITTAGQWINPFVFGLLWLQRHVAAPRKVRRPIFIIGTGRSGTTILGVVMSMHKDAAFLNEPKAVWHSAFGSEDLIGSYGKGRANYCLSEADASPAVIKAMNRIYGWYLTATLSRRVVDKYPELVFRVPFVRRIFPDAKFLFLVRNGWDTCHSIQHWSERLGVNEGQERHDWWGVNNRKWALLIDQVASKDPDFAPHLDELRNLQKHTDMAAVEWILTMREGLRLQALLPDAIQTVKYEHLVADPRLVLRQICDFCGLEEDPTFYGYAEKVLRPAKPVAPFELHPLIEAPFHQTMQALGYEQVEQ
ncbi:sulfotransferase family protein [Solimonas variicoloris]|uniref:sulfotransferase family protein n=1 Tax=Solimonas variicoloris TaxID=254408 RepID=UPI0003722A10|nr:sulfotransferase [Solimonas variicoloris]